MEILYQDQNYLIVNKPRGLLTHASVDAKRENLFHLLQKQFGPELYLHHRLDKETSGAILLTRNKRASAVADQLFQERLIKKEYLALVQNSYDEKNGEYKDYVRIQKVNNKEKLIIVPKGKGGQWAHLQFQWQKEVQKNGLDLSLVLFTLHTGRRHQIRAQSAHHGHPLFGDTFYGGAINDTTKTFYLHAVHLAFGDPISGHTIDVEAPLPSDWFSEQAEEKNEQKVIAFNKPYGILCQFSGEEANLSSFSLPAHFYPAGRLDKDSEGLLILSDSGPIIDRIASPQFEKRKTYWVQVERIPEAKSLQQLALGLDLGDFKTLPCQVRRLSDEEVALIHPRVPPIRQRLTVPDCWLEIILTEGKNRQVRRMTAKIGHPTLRLMRVAVGAYHLYAKQQLEIAVGQWQWIPLSALFS